jgi:hypothetical protein
VTRLHLAPRGWRPPRLLVLTCAISALLVAPALALAQSSPAASWYMFDSRPFNGYPPKFSGESNNPQAVVVEGLGAGQCGTSTLYTEAKIEQQTVAWVNSFTPTVTEITPQATCASLSTYEAEIDRIVAYVEANAGAEAGDFWAGIMIDEEVGYGFSVSSLESLNNHLTSTMSGTPGMSWFFLEDQPNGWSLSNYNSILAAGGFPAPQAYTSSMATAVDNECSTYSRCENLVTVWDGATPSWNDPEYTLPRINGSAWHTTYSAWFPGQGWWNGYRNQ